MKIYAEKYAANDITLENLQATKLKVVNEGSIQGLKDYVKKAEAKAVRGTTGLLGKSFLAPLLKKPTPITVCALSDLYLTTEFAKTDGQPFIPAAPTSPYDAAKKFLEIRENPEIIPAGTPPRRASVDSVSASISDKPVKKSVSFSEINEVRIFERA